MREKIVVLYSHNPSRLAHLRKLESLKGKFYFILVTDISAPKELLENYVEKVILIKMNVYQEKMQYLCEEINKIGIPVGVINFSEVCVPLQKEICDFYKLLGPNQNGVDIARNKYIMRKFCEKIEIPVPKYCIYENREFFYKKMKYPVVAKPIIGGGSTLVRRFDSIKELESNIESMKSAANAIYEKDALFHKYQDGEGNLEFLIEEVIGGKIQFPSILKYPIGEISVESIYYNNETIILGIHDKPIPSNGPYFEEYIWSTPSRIPFKLYKKALEYVGRIHENLGKGAYVLHTEFRTYENELVLLEFGARLGGGPIYKSLLYSTGNDYIDILIALSKNEKPYIKENKGIPTITHCLWAKNEGKITAISGESQVVWNKFYIEHQIYDDIGDIAVRAPKSCRSNGHIVLQNKNFNFEELETHTISVVKDFVFETEQVI